MLPWSTFFHPPILCGGRCYHPPLIGGETEDHTPGTRQGSCHLALELLPTASLAFQPREVLRQVLSLFPSWRRKTEAPTLPSHSERRRERKTVQTQVCLPPARDLSHQVTRLSPTEHDLVCRNPHGHPHPEPPVWPEGTGHTEAEEAKPTNLVEDRVEQGRAALLGCGPGKRMEKQGFWRGNRTQSAVVSRALRLWPLPLGQTQRS